MENENEPMAPPDLPESELLPQFLWLRKQLLMILVLTVVICGGADLLLWHQVRYGSAEVKTMNAMMEDYGQKVEPFLRRVVEYAVQHPEFRPVLAKYPIALPQNAAPANRGGPAPAPSPAPKK